MGQFWTDEMEEHWQAVVEEAANPKDFLVVRDVNVNDRLRGFIRYIVDPVRYRIVGGVEPFMSLWQQIESANIERQIGPERLKENREWLAAEADEDDPFEGFYFDED